MKNTLTKLLLTGSLIAALTSTAIAQSIAGRIDIGAYGSTVSIDYTANTVTFNEGVGFGSINAQVTNASGDYSVFAPTLASVTPATYFDFNYTQPFAPAGQRIWEINAGTYFELGSLSNVTETPNGLVLTGLGTAYLTGFDPTAGLWSFSADRNQGEVVFSFSSTTQVPPPSVPEGGATAFLMGMALLSVGAIRRFVVRA